jgi:Lar family restriction alleviation protein
MANKRLKPCPFCGEREHLYRSYRRWGAGNELDGPYGIDCLGCGIDFIPRDGMDVVAAWNRRVVAEPVDG